ncbi:MAG: tetratricopeptide repeat protein [Candidatus Acidiferrales bacterium]
MVRVSRQLLARLKEPRVLLTSLAGLTLAGAVVTYIILLFPGSPLMRWVEAEPPEHYGMITIGPYPQEEDFPRLKHAGVKYIVSLLDPEIPYEKPMLEREMALGKKYGLEVKNFPIFPMDSILGTEMLPASLEQQNKAVEFLENLDAPAYVHCYLARHRAIRVRAELMKSEALERSAPVGGSGREDWELLNRITEAQLEFRNKNYGKVLYILEPVKTNDVEVANLRGWAYFRLGLINDAAESFRQALAASPNNPRALLGLGYCYLRTGSPVMAQRQFAAILEQIPDNPDALTGEGLAYLAMQNKKAAAERFRAVLQQRPDYKEVKDYLKQAESP